MFRSRRLSVPALVAAFVGGSLAATAFTGAGASGEAASGTSPSPHRLATQSGVSPQSAGCAVNLIAGPAPAQNYNACISGHGNVNGFSWGDASDGGPYNYLDNEGYCIKRDFDAGASPTSYYDAGSAGEAGFGVATTSMGSPKTYSVIRTTLDGVLTVTQNFFLKPGSSQLFIGVIVKNNDSVSHEVLVERYFHPRLFGTSTVHWEDVKQMETSAANTGIGIHLAALSRNVFSAGGQTLAGAGRLATPAFLSTGKSACYSTSSASASTPGDNYGGVTEFNGWGVTPTIPAGASQTFQFAYRIY
jgi:hypothetical protein